MSFDTPAANKAFAEKFGFPFRLLSDISKSLAVACGAAADTSAQHPRRLTFVIGKDGKVEQAIDTKDPAGQAASLLPTL